MKLVTATGHKPGLIPVSHKALTAMDSPETYIPIPHRRGLVEFLDHGRQVDSFLMCVLDNNLSGAIREANAAAALHIVSMVRWLWKYAPASAWGSEGARRGWADARHRDALQAA